MTPNGASWYDIALAMIDDDPEDARAWAMLAAAIDHPDE